MPNVGEPAKDIYQRLVVEYDPNFDDLVLSEHDGRLRLHFGDGNASILIEAMADVKAGRGDYFLPSKNHKDVPPIWIWWMVRAKQ